VSSLFPTPELKKIYSRYPALARTKTWLTVSELANSGKAAEAWELADKASKSSRQVNAQNVMARKVRIERVKFFALQTRMGRELSDLLAATGKRVADQALGIRNTPAQIRDGKKMVTVEVSLLRRALTKWSTDFVWESVEMGIAHIEAAMLPVFKDNQEQLHHDTWKEMNLIEERLTFGISKELAGKGSPEIGRSTQAYRDVTDKAYAAVVQRNNNGLKFSSRLWDQTKQAELDMRRILENEISQGTSSQDVAKHLEGYLQDEPVPGTGVYAKPRANAMRLARTETNRAYVAAQAEWAKTRSWVKGMMVTLSSAHEETGCECEAEAGKVLDPEEFASTVPVHPHCMCYPTMVIKDEYLNVEEGARAEAVL